MSYPDDGMRTSILCFVTISRSLVMYNLLSTSGNTSCASDIKKPAEIGFESEATILTGYFTIFKDFMVLIPAGAEALGTNMVEFEIPFKCFFLSEIKFYLIIYKNFQKSCLVFFYFNTPIYLMGVALHCSEVLSIKYDNNESPDDE